MATYTGQGNGGGRLDGGTAAHTRIMLRPLGSPLPLGFFGFGVGMLITAFHEFGWVPQGDLRFVALIALVFSLPLEIITSVIAFFGRDGGAGTILGIFATSWAVFGASALLLAPPMTDPTVGVFYCALALVSLLVGIAEAANKPALALLVIVAAARFGLVGAYQLSGSGVVKLIGAIAGLTVAAVAFYAAQAMLVFDSQHRMVLPLFRRRVARVATEGALDDQLTNVPHEAGVRQQL